MRRRRDSRRRSIPTHLAAVLSPVLDGAGASCARGETGRATGERRRCATALPTPTAPVRSIRGRETASDLDSQWVDCLAVDDAGEQRHRHAADLFERLLDRRDRRHGDAAMVVSSNPTTERSSGMRMPRARASATRPGPCRRCMRRPRWADRRGRAAGPPRPCPRSCRTRRTPRAPSRARCPPPLAPPGSRSRGLRWRRSRGCL